MNLINKKGLSDIIATVLIILLALAAVVIVWQFVRPMVSNTAQQTNLQSKCLNVEAVPTACKLSDDNNNKITFQLVRGNPGDIAKIIGIAEKKTDKTTQVKETTTIPNVLETGDIIGFNKANQPSDYIAKVAVVVKDANGNTFTCGESQVTVTCA